MHFQHPTCLGIDSAALVIDHQIELDAEIERRLQFADELAERSRDSPLRKKLLKLRESR
jgi:hypothetical protein